MPTFEDFPAHGYIVWTDADKITAWFVAREYAEAFMRTLTDHDDIGLYSCETGRELSFTL